MTTDTLATDTTTQPRAVWMSGDHYTDTADEPIHAIADRIRNNVDNVQGDGLIPAQARFTITAEATGPTDILRTTITGLSADDDPDQTATRTAMRVVFELASHYNRVNLTNPDQARFVHHITAIRDGVPYRVLVATMLGDGHTDPHPDHDTGAGHPTSLDTSIN